MLCGSDSALALKKHVNTCKGGLRPATFLKKYFPVKFTKFLRALIFTEHLRWLLLKHCFEMSHCTIN